MSIGDRARAAREDKGIDPRPISAIRAEEAEIDIESAAVPEPVTPPVETPVDPIAALVQALNRVQAPAGISKDDLAEVMQSNSEGMRRALKPENARHPDVSAFNPDGERDHPRPKLLRKTWLSGMELHEDDLEVEEITLLNRFTHTQEARNGAWRAELLRTSSKGVEELHINVPCASVDDRMDLPNGLKLILMELHGGSKATDPMELAARVAELEKQLLAKAGG